VLPPTSAHEVLNLNGNMLIIKKRKGEDINKMLKRFKSKWKRTGTLQELRSRQSFTKKSKKRREQLGKAKYVQSIIDSSI
tara:strand:- start:28 stop:267 length:240 start_codon:yes stop_codon:yes gene_type:complete